MHSELDSHIMSLKIKHDEDWIRPDTPTRCTWKLGEVKQSPHNFENINELSDFHKNSMKSILGAVGFTPLVLLRNVMTDYGLKCNLYAKCEFLSPFGSVKDRIALRMVTEAERSGTIRPGFTLIEPTSGNTGIGIAAVAAVKGYHCIIVIPQKMSNEKVSVLKALGARVIRTPTSASFDSPESNIRYAQRLQKKIPNSVILDQYRNPYNPISHYDTTAEEIIIQTKGILHSIVVGAGTGGTITGISRKIKEKIPSCHIVGVDPIGSILAQPDSLNSHGIKFYEVEGIGYDFIPTVLDRDNVDEWIKVGDSDALIQARELVRREALLCGASSGSAVFAAIKVAQKMKEGETCVVLLPDSIRNYMTKFLDDNWMMERGFIQTSISSNYKEKISHAINELKFDSCEPLSPYESIDDAMEKLEKLNIDSLPIVDKDNMLLGVFDTNVMMDVYEKNFSHTSPVSTCMDTLYKRAFFESTTVESLFYMFRSSDHVYIVTKKDADQFLFHGMISKRKFLGQISKL